MKDAAAWMAGMIVRHKPEDYLGVLTEMQREAFDAGAAAMFENLEGLPYEQLHPGESIADYGLEGRP